MAWPRRCVLASVLGISLAHAACLPFQAYSCEHDDQCTRNGEQGTCEDDTKWCSFPDPACGGEDGRRYERYAGNGLAGQCVSQTVAEGSGSSTGTSTSESEAESTSAPVSTSESESEAESGSDTETKATCGRAGLACCERDACDPDLACFDGRCGCVVDLAAGRTHTCLRKLDGTVACWGANDRGQIPGSVAAFEPRPLTLPNLTDVQALAVADHGCALRSEGDLRCWGGNAFGQAVPGLDVLVPEPTEVVLGGPAERVAVGDDFTCATRSEGVAMTCFGSNALGQLANAVDPGPGPLDLPGEVEWAELELGAQHGCGRTVTGEMYCWGDNTYGQLGEDPSLLPSSSAPVRMALPPVGDIAVGLHHTCARENTTVHCFGNNDVGQLGNGTLTTTFDPDGVVALPEGTVVVTLVSGPRHTCVLGQGDAVVCWGSNDGGQLLLEPDAQGFDEYATVPVAVDLGDLAIARLVGGVTHACALTRQGEVYCWGENNRGQIGDGTTSYAFVPTRVDVACP